MDFKEIILLTIASISERKFRNILTIIMIIMGCSLLVSLSSLTQGLITFVEQNFKKILPNQIVISNTDKLQQSSIDEIRNKLEVLFDKNMTLVEKKIPINIKTINYIKNLSGVESIIPAYQGVLLLKFQNKTQITNALSLNLSNIEQVIPQLDTRTIEKPAQNNEQIIIIPQKIGEKLFSNNKTQNNQLMVSVQKLNELTNVSKTSSLKNDNMFKVFLLRNSTENPITDNSVFIPLLKGKEILNKNNEFDLLFITYNDVNKVEGIVNKIKEYFNDQITILNSLEIVKTITKFITGISTFISSIAIFSLVVGSLGIIITIYTSVVERTQEIGILKALGGTNNTILAMFLTESLIIGIAGTIIGILVGFFGSYILLSSFVFFLKIPLQIYPMFNLYEISKISIIVISLSIFSGLYPAYKGSKISPVNALSKFF